MKQTLIRATNYHDNVEEAEDSLAGTAAIPNYVFGYVEHPQGSKPRTIVFFTDTDPTLPLPKPLLRVSCQQGGHISQRIELFLMFVKNKLCDLYKKGTTDYIGSVEFDTTRPGGNGYSHPGERAIGGLLAVGCTLLGLSGKVLVTVQPNLSAALFFMDRATLHMDQVTEFSLLEQPANLEVFDAVVAQRISNWLTTGWDSYLDTRDVVARVCVGHDGEFEIANATTERCPALAELYKILMSFIDKYEIKGTVIVEFYGQGNHSVTIDNPNGVQSGAF